MVWSEGSVSLKNPVTPPGIDPGTFRLVPQRLNHYATPGPIEVCVCIYIYLRLDTANFNQALFVKIYIGATF